MRRINHAQEMNPENDVFWMGHALRAAQCAWQKGEIPVGAVLVKDNRLVATAYNCPISTLDPTAHAEIIALRRAALELGNYRLVDTTLYVTLEPCAMCAYAMVHARIARLVFGALDTKAGAVLSCARALDAPFLNHRIAYSGEVLAPACSDLLKQFFREKRSPPARQ